MKYFVFDTETTDMWSTGEVIQFAGVLTDDNFNVERVINFYCDTLQSISPDAQAVHGITKEELVGKSNGRFFENYRNGEYKWLFDSDDIVWIGWNVQFDMRMVNNTLVNNGYAEVDFGKRVHALNVTSGRNHFDLMPAVSGLLGNSYRMKLLNAFTACGYTSDNADDVFRKLNTMFKLNGEDESAKFHRAEYDAIVTWMIASHFSDRLR